MCTEKHICALKIYICALKNISVMCSDQYICTEIFICALHIWTTVDTDTDTDTDTNTNTNTNNNKNNINNNLFLAHYISKVSMLVQK